MSKRRGDHLSPRDSAKRFRSGDPSEETPSSSNLGDHPMDVDDDTYNRTEDPLKILSLDGGGAGLSSLLILQDVMEGITRDDHHTEHARPCDRFDVICGTGPGGISALFLGCLGMSSAEAAKEYIFLSKSVLVPKQWLGRPQLVFDAKRLESSLKQIVKRHTGNQDTLLSASRPGRSRTFVLAASRDHPSAPPMIFRSDDSDTYKIWEVALAITALPDSQDPVLLGEPPEAFVDATFCGHKNPTEFVLEEISDLWPDRKVGLILSIGTGVKRIVALSETNAMGSILQDSTHVDERLVQRYEGGYFRFDVDRGLDDISPEDWHQSGNFERLTGITRSYMRYQRQIGVLKLLVARYHGRHTCTTADGGEDIIDSLEFTDCLWSGDSGNVQAAEREGNVVIVKQFYSKISEQTLGELKKLYRHANMAKISKVSVERDYIMFEDLTPVSTFLSQLVLKGRDVYQGLRAGIKTIGGLASALLHVNGLGLSISPRDVEVYWNKHGNPTILYLSDITSLESSTRGTAGTRSNSTHESALATHNELCRKVFQPSETSIKREKGFRTFALKLPKWKTERLGAIDRRTNREGGTTGATQGPMVHHMEWIASAHGSGDLMWIEQTFRAKLEAFPRQASAESVNELFHSDFGWPGLQSNEGIGFRFSQSAEEVAVTVSHQEERQFFQRQLRQQRQQRRRQEQQQDDDEDLFDEEEEFDDLRERFFQQQRRLEFLQLLEQQRERQQQLQRRFGYEEDVSNK